METKATPIVDSELIVKVAKNLQGSYTKLTQGEARKWRDVPPEERKIWLRQARIAARILVPDDSSATHT